MSILIKGMAMPTNCYKCPFLDYEEGFCFASGVKHESGWYESTLCPGVIKDKRHEECPLVPVPPHGRLIDADALMHEFEKAQRTMEQHGQEYSCSFMSSGREISTEWYCVEDMVENAPTVIQAEGEDDG